MRHFRQPVSARSVLAAIGAVLLAIQGVIHVQLWAQGYREIAAVGPLFLAGGAGALVLAGPWLCSVRAAWSPPRGRRWPSGRSPRWGWPPALS